MMEAEAVPEATMTDECKEILEWSRHYDNLLWFVTSFLTGANAALMAISADKLRPQIGLFGMLLTIATVFLATSFRSIRRRLHCRLKNIGPKYMYLVKGDDRLKQWRLYVLFFVLVVFYWFWLLWANCPRHRCISAIARVFSLAFLGFSYVQGKSPSD